MTLRFTEADAVRAHEEWGANCGPGAIAAIMRLTLDELRPQMGGFEAKRYTNPTLMFAVLDRLGARWRQRRDRDDNGTLGWPRHGLARIQWEGPWTRPGVPIRARYRHSHWVAAELCRGQFGIFDINAMNSGGWVAERDWVETIVPWILRECVPRASGRWHITHSIEIERPVAG